MTLRHPLPPFFNLQPEGRAPWSKIFILPNNRKNFIYCQNILNCIRIVLCPIKYLFFGVKCMRKLLVFRMFRRGWLKPANCLKIPSPPVAGSSTHQLKNPSPLIRSKPHHLHSKINLHFPQQ